jgi:hypothetical protein
VPTRTNRLQGNADGGGAGHGTGGFTTSSFTPSNSSLLTVVCFAITETDGAFTASDLTIADSIGLTWTSRAATSAAPAWSQGIRVWTAPVSTGASMTVTVDAGAFNVHGYRVEVYDYTSYDTTTPIGATATGTDADGDGAASITLSATPRSDSEIMACACIGIATNGTHATTPGTSWTELFDVEPADGWLASETQIRTTYTGTSVDWVDLETGTAVPDSATLLAFEVRDVAASVPSVTLVNPDRFLNAQANIVISGSTFGASQGAGAVIISPSDNVNDAGAVTQTVTSWADTSITFTAVRSSLAMGTNLYLFVRENGGSSNASGYIVQFIGSASVAWVRA